MLDTPIWYQAYRRAYSEMIRPADYEFVNHPFAVIAAVTSDHTDPIAALAALYNHNDASHSYIVTFSTYLLV